MNNRRLFQTRENFTFRDKKIFSLIPNLNEAGIKENLAENPRFLQLSKVREFNFFFSRFSRFTRQFARNFGNFHDW